MESRQGGTDWSANLEPDTWRQHGRSRTLSSSATTSVTGPAAEDGKPLLNVEIPAAEYAGGPESAASQPTPTTAAAPDSQAPPIILKPGPQPHSAPISTDLIFSPFFLPTPELTRVIDTLIPSKITTETPLRLQILHLTAAHDVSVLYPWFIHYCILYDEGWLLIFAKNPRKRGERPPLQGMVSMEGVKEVGEGMWGKEIAKEGVFLVFQALSREEGKEWRPAVGREAGECASRPPQELSSIVEWIPRQRLDLNRRRRPSYDIRVLPSSLFILSSALSSTSTKFRHSFHHQPVPGPVPPHRSRIGRFFSASSSPSREAAPFFGGLLQHIVEREESEFGGEVDLLRPRVPAFVVEATRLIEERGMDVLGVYRISGNQSAVSRARAKYNEPQSGLHPSASDSAFDLAAADIHTITSLLKMFIRELAEPLIPGDLYDCFIHVMKTTPDLERPDRLAELIQELPSSHRDTLKHLVSHLAKMSLSADVTRMDVQNLSKIFGPNVMRLPGCGIDGIAEIGMINAMIAELIIAQQQQHQQPPQGEMALLRAFSS